MGEQGQGWGGTRVSRDQVGVQRHRGGGAEGQG